MVSHGAGSSASVASHTDAGVVRGEDTGRVVDEGAHHRRVEGVPRPCADQPGRRVDAADELMERRVLRDVDDAQGHRDALAAGLAAGPRPSQRAVRSPNRSRTPAGMPRSSQSISATSHIASRWPPYDRPARGMRATPCSSRTGAGLSGSASARRIARVVSREEPNITGAKCRSSAPGANSAASVSASAVQPT